MKRHRDSYWTKIGMLRDLDFELKISRRGKKFFAIDKLRLAARQIITTYKLKQHIKEIFRGLKQSLGWRAFRYRNKQTVTAHLALGLTTYALIELARTELKLSFYKYHRQLITRHLAPPIYCLDGISIAAWFQSSCNLLQLILDKRAKSFRVLSYWSYKYTCASSY